MMATVPHVTSGLGLRKFQADGFLLTRVYMTAALLSDITQPRVLIPYRHFGQAIGLGAYWPLKMRERLSRNVGTELTLYNE